MTRKKADDLNSEPVVNLNPENNEPDETVGSEKKSSTKIKHSMKKEKIKKPNSEAQYAIDKLAEVALKVNTDGKRRFYFRIALVALIIIGLIWIVSSRKKEVNLADFNHIALVYVDEPIFDSEDTIEQLKGAFENPFAKAIFLLLNSPGGSAVQSAQIHQQIQKYKAQNKKPIYAFISDLCTSGCYYVAAATDEIYAHEASLVGSIGVLIQSFGVTELMQKIGIESRSYTAGKDKDFLSPFAQINSEQKDHIIKQMQIIHQKFIDDVKSARGDRLNNDQAELFTGLVWAGNQAKDYGLIDGFYYFDDFAKDKFAKMQYLTYEKELDWPDRIFKRISSEASSLIQELKMSSIFLY